MINPKIAMAAAHNITPRTVASWYPYLRRTPRVMVPIQLDVMIVRDPNESWANCGMMQPDPNVDGTVRLDLLPPPFEELQAKRPLGAYLHWALPDALTHGTSDGTTGNFYAIPDRWLVLRLSPPTQSGTRRAVHGWVIRAGDATPTVTELDQWKETGASPDPVKKPLTAMGHGDPAWSAYYDNVVNRLGFYDPLSGIKNGPLAYIVCGWYFDPTLDPLGDPNIHSLREFDATMNQMQWAIDSGEFEEAVSTISDRIKAANLVGLQTLEYTGKFVNPAITTATNAAAPRTAMRARANIANIPPSYTVDLGNQILETPAAPLDDSGLPPGGEYTSNGSWWPTGSFYHGCVVGIGWPGIGWPGAPNGLLGSADRPGADGGEFGGPPPASAINVVVGNTITEALAALVAHTNGSPEEATMLEAYLLGALNEVDKPDGQANIDSLLHAASFATRDGGYVTETIVQPPMPDLPPKPPSPVTPDPGVFAWQKHSSRVEIGGLEASPGVLNNRVGEVQAIHNADPSKLREDFVIKGELSDVIQFHLPVEPAPPVVQPAKTIQVQRSLPRFFQPADPVVLVQGGARSFKHGGDGRFTQDGKLICRLTGFCVTELACRAFDGKPIRPSVGGDDVLERGVENGSVPLECEDILREVVLIDPGTALPAAQANVGSRIAADQAAIQGTARNFMVEQTAWWAARDPRIDASAIVANSGFRGTLPSPVAVNLPTRPWTPIHLDWEIEYVASPGEVSDWSLDELDFLSQKTSPPQNPDQPGIVLTGRAHLTAGAASTAAQGVKTALQQATSSAGAGSLQTKGSERFFSVLAQTMTMHLDSLNQVVARQLAGTPTGQTGQIDRSALNDIITALDDMDVLSGALDNFHTRLRGGLTGDGVTVPPVGTLTPKPFVPLRSGFMRVRRLRLVDGFGQFVDLAGSSDQAQVDPNKIMTSGPASVPNAPGVMAMPPRLTSPSRLWLRFLQAADDTKDATADVSPVCGYLLPNHLDGAVEFFDTTGTNLGVVRPDAQAGIVWEEAPGQPTSVGADPARAMPDTPKLAGIAQALIQWGLSDAMASGQHEDALSALLRILDSTLWSVDPFAHTGDEHLSFLVGHPVVVMRARVFLEVQEPVTPDVINMKRFPLRLGALTHLQDGLLGYFVNDDYTTLYCADGAAAGLAREVGPNRGFLQQINLVPDFYQTFSDDIGAGVKKGNSPVNHPYVDTTGLLWIAPNQPYTLTMLVEPQCRVHATMGLLPRKDIGMRREWIAAALAKIAPTFRFGPLLVDPKRVRMPVATEIKGTWSWDHRADISKWQEDPVINSTSDAIIPPDPVEGTEGWLRLAPPTDTSSGQTGP